MDNMDNSVAVPSAVQSVRKGGVQRISPTMLSTWERSRVDWMRTYIGVPMKGPDGEIVLTTVREPQTEPMAAGSAFDAYVKEVLIQGGDAESISSLDITSSPYWKVEPWNVEYGVKIGKYLLKKYTELGGMIRFQRLINEGVELFMEEKVSGEITGESTVVPIGGFPDLFWYEDGVLTVHDWKVSQIKNDKPTIMKGYSELMVPPLVKVPRNATLKPGDGDGDGLVYTHPDAGIGLEEIDSKFADQLTIYAWLCGSEVGKPIVGAIDRLCGMPLRVCRYRGMIGEEYQMKLVARLEAAWIGIQDMLALKGILGKDSGEGVANITDVSSVMMLESSSFYR